MFVLTLMYNVLFNVVFKNTDFKIDIQFHIFDEKNGMFNLSPVVVFRVKYCPMTTTPLLVKMNIQSFIEPIRPGVKK